MHSSRFSSVLVTTKLSRIIFGARLATDAASDTSTDIPTKNFEDIPGLPSLPIIGPAYHFLPFIGVFGSLEDSYDMMEIVNKKYGSLVRMGSVLTKPPMLFAYDPDDMEYILRHENSMPIRPGFDSLEYFRKHVKKEEYDGYGGLLADHGEGWKKFRSTVNPVMLQPKTIKLYAEAIDQVAQDMVKRLKRIRNPDNTISGDFELEMNKWALESIALVGLGGRIGCLEDDLPEDSPARQLIQCVRDCFEIIDEVDLRLSPWRYFSTPAFRRAMKIYETQMKLSEGYIKKAIEDMNKRKIANDDASMEDSILKKLLEINEKVALIMASDMMFAGVDTAAHTMMALLYNLAKNPEKQSKLREEVKAGVEKKYLKACMKENMRLSPVVIGNLRRTTRELKLRNYLIPKGIDVIFPHTFVSRQESQYLRAKEFLPERWLVGKDDPLHYGSAHPMTTLPFGYGVRSCIGRRIAELEVEMFLGRVIENFEVEWVGPPPKIKTKALNYMMGPYNFVFKDVN